MGAIAKGTFSVEMKPLAEPSRSEGISLGRMALVRRSDEFEIALPD